MRAKYLGFSLSFRSAMLLAATVWCTFFALMWVLAAVVVLHCTSPESAFCGEPGVDAARQLAKLVWWALPLFGAGVAFGIRGLKTAP